MSNEFIAYCGNECRPVNFNTAPLKQGLEIYASVGINGVNQSADVEIIQQALNGVPANQGRPNPLLEVDGICGAKTKSAIQNFQLKHFGWSGADGRADPGGVTIAKLNEVSGDPAVGYQFSAVRMSETSPVVGAARVARVRALIGQIRLCIEAAIKDAEMALPLVGAPIGNFASLNREARMLLLNRHFDIDSFTVDRRLPSVIKILKIFRLMLGVFDHPGGLWGAAVFDYDRTTDDVYAFTAWGGYFRQGAKSWAASGRIRQDTIYLSRKLDRSSNDQVIMTIIHELAHFVSYPESINDDGYGWVDDPRMKRLPPWHRLYTAESYCNYAFDAQFGRAPK